MEEKMRLGLIGYGSIGSAVVKASMGGCLPGVELVGITDLAGIDKSVLPGDDFNAYTNGGWIKSTPIPSDKSSYGIDAILTDETRKRTLALIEVLFAQLIARFAFGQRTSAREAAGMLLVVCGVGLLLWAY